MPSARSVCTAWQQQVSNSMPWPMRLGPLPSTTTLRRAVGRLSQGPSSHVEYRYGVAEGNSAAQVSTRRNTGRRPCAWRAASTSEARSAIVAVSSAACACPRSHCSRRAMRRSLKPSRLASRSRSGGSSDSV